MTTTSRIIIIKKIKSQLVLRNITDRTRNTISRIWKSKQPMIYHQNPNRCTTEIQQVLQDGISSGMTSDWQDQNSRDQLHPTKFRELWMCRDVLVSLEALQSSAQILVDLIITLCHASSSPFTYKKDQDNRILDLALILQVWGKN